MSATIFFKINYLARWVSSSFSSFFFVCFQVAAFGWCGSAVVGGWLVDEYDYGATFLATAFVQACAVLVWLALAPLVSNVELRAAPSPQRRTGGGGAAPSPPAAAAVCSDAQGKGWRVGEDSDLDTCDDEGSDRVLSSLVPSETSEARQLLPMAVVARLPSK